MTSADTTIAVTLNLFGDLRRYQRPGENGPMRLTCSKGDTVADLLRALAIPHIEDTAISLTGNLVG